MAVKVAFKFQIPNSNSFAGCAAKELQYFDRANKATNAAR